MRGRPFKQGQPKPAKSGRKPNTPNKVQAGLKAALLEALPDQAFADLIRKHAERGIPAALKIRAEYTEGTPRPVSEQPEPEQFDRFARAIGAVVFASQDGFGAPGNPSILAGPGEVQDGSRGQAELQDGTGKAGVGSDGPDANKAESVRGGSDS